MSTSSVIMSNNEIRCLDLLLKSVRYMSCGKLKKGSELINEALRFGLNDSENVFESIAECKKLGLIIQTRKYLLKADQLQKAKQYTEALERYQTIGCVGIPHDLAFQVLHNKAVCMVQVGNLNGSLAYFRQALAIDPMHSLALRNSAYVLMTLKMYDTALHFFSDLIRLDEIDPSHLLYVLYGAAECRQVLYPSREGEDAVLRAQHAVEQHQHLQARRETNNTPTPKESYLYSKKAISHTVYDKDPLSICQEEALQIDTSEQESVQIVTHLPFRRIRYEANNTLPTKDNSIIMSPVSPVPTYVGPVVPFLSTVDPVSDKAVETMIVGSPLAVKSRDKREMLHRAVIEFDRSALPNGASEWNLVSANEPMLGQRRRDTNPSASDLAAPSPLHTRSWRPTEVTHHSIDTGLSTPVSNRKPGLYSRPMHMRPPNNKPVNTIGSTCSGDQSEHKPGAAPTDQEISFPEKPSPPSPPSAPTPLFAPASDPVSTASTPRSSESPIPSAPWAARLDMPVMRDSQHTRRPSSGSLDAPEIMSINRLDRSSFGANTSTGGMQKDANTPPDTVKHQLETSQEVRVSVKSWIATTVHVENDPNLPLQVDTGIQCSNTMSQKVCTSGVPSCSDASVEEKEQILYPATSVGIVGTQTGGDEVSHVTPSTVAPPATTVLVPPTQPMDMQSQAPIHRRHIADALVTHPPTPRTVPSAERPIGASPTKPPKPAGAASRAAPFIPPHTSSLSEESAIETAVPTEDCNDSLVISPTDSSMSGDFAADFGNGISPLPFHRQHLGRKGLTEQTLAQQEIDRVFESRRYVDNYTITNSDVLKLHVSEKPHFPPARETKRFYPHSVLKTPGPFPHDVDVRHREYYLSDTEFLKLFHTDKNNWDRLPLWRQRTLKQAVGLF